MKQENRGGKREGSGRPENPKEYRTLQVRGVPPEIYKTLQKYCREQIDSFKRIKKSVKF